MENKYWGVVGGIIDCEVGGGGNFGLYIVYKSFRWVFFWCKNGYREIVVNLNCLFFE